MCMQKTLLHILILFVFTFALPINADSKNKETYEYLDLFGQIFDRIRSSYVDEVTDEELIEKAIADSDLGLTPNNDGNVIRLNIPSLTEERRQELVKQVHGIIEDGRISIRNIRRDSNEQLKKLEKSHDMSEDNLKRALDNIQEITDKHIETLNQMQTDKEKELLI